MPDRKKWEELSENEILNTKAHQCSKCRYYSKLNAGTCKANTTCDYILIEGHSRGCDPRDCIKKGFFKRKSKSDPKRVSRIVL